MVSVTCINTATVTLHITHCSFIFGRLLSWAVFVSIFCYMMFCVQSLAGLSGDLSGNHLYLSRESWLFDWGHREVALLVRSIHTEVLKPGVEDAIKVTNDYYYQI
jgi:hypothetical protein